MPTLGADLDFNQLHARNMRVDNQATAPGTPVAGQMYFDTADSTLYWYDGTTWVSASGGFEPEELPDASATTKGVLLLTNDLEGSAEAPTVVNLHLAQDTAIGNKLTSVTDPTAAQDAATKNYVDGAITTNATPDATALVKGKLQLTNDLDGSAAAPTVVDLHLGQDTAINNKLTDLTDPTNDQDAATKGYVDGKATGLTVHEPVAAATTANITLSGAQTIDGVAVVAGNRVLVKDQTNAADNGIYIVAAGAWTRATDMASWGDVANAYVWVESGSTQGDSGWVVGAINPNGVIGTDDIPWVQFSSAAEITAGPGINKTGNTISASPDDLSIDTNGFGNTIQVAPGTLAEGGPSGVPSEWVPATTGITNDKLNPLIWRGWPLPAVAAGSLELDCTGRTSVLIQSDITPTTVNEISLLNLAVGVPVWISLQVKVPGGSVTIDGAYIWSAQNTGYIGGPSNAGSNLAENTYVTLIGQQSDVGMLLAAIYSPTFGQYYSNGNTHAAGTTITIPQATHGLLSTRGIQVQVQDAATGCIELPNICIASNGDVTVTYGYALTANTKLVTLTT
jgi:hypothetical protein